MDHDQILEMVKRVRKACAEELKGKQHKLDMNKNGKLDAQDFEHLRKMKEESEIEEAMSHAAKTTMKHIKNPTQGEKDASKHIQSGIKGYRDRIAMLQSAKNRGALKNEEAEVEGDLEEGWDDMLKAAKARKDAPEQKTKTSTYHDVKKTSTGTVYTKQFDPEGHSKGSGEDAAKAAEPPVKRGRGRPVGSKSGARQAGSSSKTDYRGFVDHTLNLPAKK